jgi:hypothetical protein
MVCCQLCHSVQFRCEISPRDAITLAKDTISTGCRWALAGKDDPRVRTCKGGKPFTKDEKAREIRRLLAVVAGDDTARARAAEMASV